MKFIAVKKLVQQAARHAVRVVLAYPRGHNCQCDSRKITKIYAVKTTPDSPQADALQV